jgi:hypothetical protein
LPRLCAYDLNPPLNLANSIEDLFLKANREQKRSILNLIISNLQLDGNLLRWKYKKPFEMMAFCSKNSTWLRIMDEVRTLLLENTEFKSRMKYGGLEDIISQLDNQKAVNASDIDSKLL